MSDKIWGWPTCGDKTPLLSSLSWFSLSSSSSVAAAAAAEVKDILLRGIPCMLETESEDLHLIGLLHEPLVLRYIRCHVTGMCISQRWHVDLQGRVLRVRGWGWGDILYQWPQYKDHHNMCLSAGLLMKARVSTLASSPNSHSSAVLCYIIYAIVILSAPFACFPISLSVSVSVCLCFSLSLSFSPLLAFPRHLHSLTFLLVTVV